MLNKPATVTFSTLSLWAACACAQQSVAPPPAAPLQPAGPAQAEKLTSNGFTKEETTYKFRFDPSLWYVGLSGQVKLPGAPVGATGGKLSEIGADKPRLAPMGAVRMGFENWRVSLSAFGVSVNTTGIASKAGQFGSFVFAPGSTVRSSIDLASAQLMGGYSFGTWSTGKASDGKPTFSVESTLLAGVRMYDLSMGFGNVAANVATTNQLFAEPIIGARADIDMAHGFSIDAESTFGYLPGEHGSASLEITVGLLYRPIENVGIRAGYRNMRFNLYSGKDANKFELNGGAAGLFVGFEVRF